MLNEGCSTHHMNGVTCKNEMPRRLQEDLQLHTKDWTQ
jgi:hypothetical protein